MRKMKAQDRKKRFGISLTADRARKLDYIKDVLKQNRSMTLSECVNEWYKVQVK